MHLDEEFVRLHLEKIGVKLSRLTKKQSDYLGVSPEGPYKPEHPLLNEFKIKTQKANGEIRSPFSMNNICEARC